MKKLKSEHHFKYTNTNNLYNLCIEKGKNLVVSENSTSGVEKESGFYPERGRLWSLRTSLQIHEHPQFVQIVEIDQID